MLPSRLPEVREALAPEEPEQAADFPNYYFGGERLLDGRAVYEPLEAEIEESFGLTREEKKVGFRPGLLQHFQQGVGRRIGQELSVIDHKYLS